MQQNTYYTDIILINGRNKHDYWAMSKIYVIVLQPDT